MVVTSLCIAAIFWYIADDSCKLYATTLGALVGVFLWSAVF